MEKEKILYYIDELLIKEQEEYDFVSDWQGIPENGRCIELLKNIKQFIQEMD